MSVKPTFICLALFSGTSLVAQTVKHLPTMQETWVQSLGQEDLLEKEMATHSSILAWKTPSTEEPGRLQWGHKESDTTELLHFLFFLFFAFSSRNTDSHFISSPVCLIGTSNLTSKSKILIAITPHPPQTAPCPGHQLFSKKICIKYL